MPSSPLHGPVQSVPPWGTAPTMTPSSTCPQHGDGLQEHPTDFGKRIAKLTVDEFGVTAGEQLRSRLSRTVLASVVMSEGEKMQVREGHGT